MLMTYMALIITEPRSLKSASQPIAQADAHYDMLVLNAPSLCCVQVITIRTTPGLPANARYLLGVFYPSSKHEHKHAVTL